MTEQTSEDFGNVPNASAGFGKVPHDAESFGTVPQASERFGTLRHVSERKESHTLTVRETARLFEDAGVARTERSIVNWCQPNKMGIARLDSYFDPNERKYFITSESVRLAIEEEKAKADKEGAARPSSSHEPDASSKTETRAHASFGKIPLGVEDASELRKENNDLKIANRAKDFFIEQLKIEREHILGQLIESSHKNGELETKLLQIDGKTLQRT